MEPVAADGWTWQTKRVLRPPRRLSASLHRSSLGTAPGARSGSRSTSGAVLRSTQGAALRPRLGPTWVVAALAGLALSAGCDRPVAGGAVDGKEVFAAACATCHGAEGTPPPSMAAQLGVRDLRSPEFRARTTVELVEHQVRTGSSNKLMPAFAGALSEAQIRAVATYVTSAMGSTTAPAKSP
jgi:mono/diheme cytochrome c family protein